MKEYVVYMHINKTNNKKYVGKTSLKPEQRWGRDGCNYKEQVFWNAISKYGWDNFEHIIVVRGLSEEEANWLEVELIAAWDTTNPKNGYNVSKGGDVWSEEMRQKASNTRKGRCHSEETKKKLSESQKGKNNSMFGKSGELSPRYGKILSEETRQKISTARKERGVAQGSNNPSARKVLCVELNMVFDTMKEAGTYVGCSPSNICSCCTGKQKTCGGYHWEYASQ
jgi:group I intron endonuclease